MFRSPETHPYISEVEPVEIPEIQYDTEIRWFNVGSILTQERLTQQERELQ